MEKQSSEVRPFRRPKAHPPSESTAQFVKAFLSENGKGYAYGMYKVWCDHLHRLGFKEPKLESFRKYLWILVKVGLVRKAKAPFYQVKSRFPRQYYELVVSRKGDEKAWANPQVVLYGEKARLGARRYRKQVLGLPPRKPGRPRTRWVKTDSNDSKFNYECG